VAEPILIANCSGFYGDRLAAAEEMVTGGPIDVLTGDFLAELTMLILAKNQLRDPSSGYAKTFLLQMEQVMGTCLDESIKVVSNAGGLSRADRRDRRETRPVAGHRLCRRRRPHGKDGRAPSSRLRVPQSRHR
jgi:hypothetical protein